MSGYIGVQPVPQTTQTRDSFTATANQTSFGTSGYQVGFLDVYLNGVKLAAADFTATNGSDVVLATGAALNDILEVVAFSTFSTSNGTFTGTTTFDTVVVTNTVDGRDVSVDGAKLDTIPVISTSSTASFIAKGDGSSQDGYIQLNCYQNTHGIKLKSPPHSASASYTLTFPNDDGTANQLLSTDGSGVLSWATVSASDSTKLPLAGGAMTGAITTNSTFDGVDVGARDAVLTDTTTKATAALPKTGGAMTGAITTNSTFDGVDIATRDAVLTATTTTANAALPKTGGAMTGAITTNSTFDGRDVAADGVLATNALPKSGGALTGAVTTSSTLTMDVAASPVFDLIGGDGNSKNIIFKKQTGETEEAKIKVLSNNMTLSSAGALTLDAVGNVNLDSADGGGITLKNAGTSYGLAFSASNSLTLKSTISNGAMIFQGNDGGTGINALTLDMEYGGAATFNGDVGIGAAANSNQQLKIYHASNSRALISTGANGASQLLFGDDASTYSGRVYYDHSNNSMRFHTDAAERMRIDSSGGMLIGTTTEGSTDADQLTISGDGRVGMTIRSANSGSNRIYFSDGTSGISEYVGYLVYDHSNNHFRIGTAAVERFRITSPGGIQIGTASGGISSGDGIILGMQNGSTGYFQKFLWANGTVGSITVQGTSVAFNTTSDYRVKTDVQPMTGASARIQALRPVNFEWIANGTRVDGFLAHEAATVVPEAVHGTKDAMMDEEYEVSAAVEEVTDDDGNITTEAAEAVMGTRNVPELQGIDQSKMVPLLVAALQEALTEITALKVRVTALEDV